MVEEVKDIRLIISIENRQPVELIDLTKSLIAFGSQFNLYASEHGESKIEKEAKLYVKEIRTGSVILELIEYSPIAIIPFMENANTVLGFAKHITAIFKGILKNDKEAIANKAELKDVNQIVNPIAKDSGSQMNISTTVNGNLQLHLHISSLEANAVQNIVSKNLLQMKLPQLDDDTKEKVLLSFWQARSDSKSEVGNKGVIDELERKPVNIVFASDELKHKMLYDDINPLKSAYVVDVKVQTVGGKIAAYKIVNMHESFELDS